jgi:phosphopantothenoylcysteine decarboxylase/phosphopantothenate--cysteine ligase
MANPINGKKITLGVTGSIAAYKAAELASRLKQQGAAVTTILTRAAQEFVTPLTFESVSGQRAYVDDDLWGGEGHVVHIAIGHNADLLVIAPASANTIAKLANGIADNLLTVTALAAACPVVIAPAMDAGMFSHPATQKNVEILKSRGATIIGPAEGHLASGLVGQGRMLEPADIISQIRFMLSRGGPLDGRKIIITAGGTQEAIDPVRMITNRSSGKQGYALAQAALDTGAEVILISAPSNLKPPFGCTYVPVTSAADMRDAVMQSALASQALIMAAAVADFKPALISKEKIKKDSGIPGIQLERTPDILTEVAALKKKEKLPIKVIGFAAESQDLKANAARKMHAKGMDMIVANDITDRQAGFEVDTNKVLLMFSDGSVEQLPVLPKSDVAEKILQHLISWLVEGEK